MTANSPKLTARSLVPDLLRADQAGLAHWLAQRRAPWILTLLILLGSGIYGASLGLWRAPAQALFTGIKFPLLIFLTCAGSALLNGMLSQLLGSRLSFRQTTVAILGSFGIASLILAGATPVALFVLQNTPPLGAPEARSAHAVILLTHVFLIACAGVTANRRLYLYLVAREGRAVARRLFWSWTGANFLLGSQLAWVLRPFIGSPQLPVQFLRDEPLRGSFYEAVWYSFARLFL